MTEIKSKNILVVSGVYFGHFTGTVEIINELVSLGHKVTCYVLEDFKGRISNKEVKVVYYDVNRKELERNIPKKAPPQAIVSLIIARASVMLFNLLSKDQNKYDYYIFDSFFEITEINKILKYDPERIISLCTVNIFTDENLNFLADRRKKAFEMINKKYSLNFGDFVTNHYTPNQYKKLILNSKYFHLRSENADDKCFFIGPSIENRKVDHDFNFKKDKAKKLIYISFGTLYFSYTKEANLFLSCINAFRDSEEYQVILSIGKNEDPKNLGDIPKNIFIYDFVPQTQLLPEVDIFITHGGLNSTGEAIYNGVPLIVIPNIFDQYDNARKLEELGAGIFLDKTKMEINEDVIKKAVNDISMNLEKYKMGMKNICDSFKEARNNRKSVYEKIFV